MDALEPEDFAVATLSAAQVERFYAVAVFRLNLIVREARKFEGDMGAWLIYCAFLMAWGADAAKSASAAAGSSDTPFCRLSAQSISQMTHIPRQTVRRKCQELCAQGILRSEGGALYAFRPSHSEIDDLVAPFIKLARKLG